MRGVSLLFERLQVNSFFLVEAPRKNGPTFLKKRRQSVLKSVLQILKTVLSMRIMERLTVFSWWKHQEKTVNVGYDPTTSRLTATRSAK